MYSSSPDSPAEMKVKNKMLPGIELAVFSNGAGDERH
jgi:hypothetical protein